MFITPRTALVLTALAFVPGAASAQKIFTDCGMGNITLLLPDQKPPKGPGCGGATAVIDIVAARRIADSAISKAEANAKALAELEGDAAAALPYGSEVLSEGAAAAQRVGEKETVWKAIHEMLLAERVKVRVRKDGDEEGEAAAEAAAGRAKEMSALATRINAADAIVKDIAKDKARLEAIAAKSKDAETAAAVIKRKAALFARLAPPKKKAE
jgi:hypothetical protein